MRKEKHHTDTITEKLRSKPRDHHKETYFLSSILQTTNNEKH